jgi:hypothetical protein
MKYLIITFISLFVYSSIWIVAAEEMGWQVCTREYSPVCAKVQVQCFRAPCYPIYKTYSNKCMMRTNPQATLSHLDVCTAFEENNSSIISDWLKASIDSQYNNLLLKIWMLDKPAQLTRLIALDWKINDAMALLVPNASLWLIEEMKNDKLRQIFSYLKDLNTAETYKLEESINWKHYLFRDSVKCEWVKFKCMDWETAFFDDVWCGCQ